MKKLLLASLLCLAPVGAMQRQVTEPKALLFDLGGIFFDVSQFEYAKQLGFQTLLGYLFFDWKNPGNMKKIIFNVLDQADIQDKDPKFKPAHYKEGRPMPYLLSAYQAGRYTTQEAKDLALDAYDRLNDQEYFSCKREAVLIKRAIKVMFDPALYIEKMIKPYPKALALLKELALLTDDSGRKRHRFIAITNWDKDSSLLLRENYADELAVFDHFVVSGETGTVKPNQEIFDRAVEVAEVAKEECLFIDDQQENVDVSVALGIPAVLYKKPGQLRKALHDRNVPVTLKEASPEWQVVPLVLLVICAVAIALLSSQ